MTNYFRYAVASLAGCWTALAIKLHGGDFGCRRQGPRKVNPRAKA